MNKCFPKEHIQMFSRYMMWYICSMEYYAAIKRNEILLFVMTWMELEGIMHGEINQSEKDN